MKTTTAVIANLVLKLKQSIRVLDRHASLAMTIIFIFVIGLIYLVQPAKPLPFLSTGGVSDEPGDTYQHPDQRGFYTNLTRGEVLTEVQEKTTLTIFGFKIPSYRLNYRPEEATTLVRDQLKSNYLEEIIYPLHSSYFVNGWEPKKAPINPNRKNPVDMNLSLHGVPYDAKITLLPITSKPVYRILIWTLIFPATYFVFKSLKMSIKDE